MTASRETFLKEGNEYIGDMLDEQANYQLSLKYDKELADIIESNINITSEEILRTSKLSKLIKEKVAAYSDKLREIIWATAAHIEQGKFQEFEQVIATINPGENEKRKIENLLQSYRKLSFSVETVKVAVEFFSMVNQRILEKVRSVSRTSPEYPNLMLMNSILVYEFTSFLVEHFGKFAVTGTEGIQQVKTDLEDQFKKAEESYQQIETSKDLEESDPELRTQVLANLAERRKIIELARQKWVTFENIFNSKKEGAEKYVTKLLPNLKVRREDAKSQLITFQATLLVKAFEANMQMADKFADIKNFELAPLTVEDVQQLFGLERETIDVEAQATQ